MELPIEDLLKAEMGENESVKQGWRVGFVYCRKQESKSGMSKSTAQDLMQVLTCHVCTHIRLVCVHVYHVRRDAPFFFLGFCLWEM